MTFRTPRAPLATRTNRRYGKFKQAVCGDWENWQLTPVFPDSYTFLASLRSFWLHVFPAGSPQTVTVGLE